VQNLKELGSKRDWSHITNQIGMFCYSGLTGEQVDTLKDKWHIYMTRNGTAPLCFLLILPKSYIGIDRSHLHGRCHLWRRSVPC